jgi:acetolactate synthase-1/2/3 large subunit
MIELSTGQAITKSLITNGIDTLFGIPGAHMYDFTDAVAQHNNELNFIVTRHEQGAAYMAYGYAKSTGKVGAYTVVPGPGVLNSSAAICTAYGANTPVLCITGNIMQDLIGKGRGQLHELPDQLTTLRSISKWAERIDQPADAPALVNEAFRQLLSGRQRPVALESPWDVFGQTGTLELLPAATPDPAPLPLAADVQAATDLIAQAKCPLIIVGAGALAAGSEVLALAEALQAPVTTHRSGKGIVSDHNPHSISSVAAYALWPEVDLVIGIGSRLELPHFRWRWQPEGMKTIRIDIDPEEIDRIPADINLLTDASIGTQAILDALAPAQRTSRTDQFIQLQQDADEALRAIQPQYDFLQAIRNELPDDGYFVEEICQAGFTARMCFEVYEPRHYVTCGYQETLGFGFNTALGVKVAHPDKAVVSICGDGGFMFGIQELATAVQYNINLVTVVFNNQSYGNVRRDQNTNYQGRLLGSELNNPDFVSLAESFGALGLRADNAEQLQLALRQGFAAGRPVIIEVPMARGSEKSPWPLLHPAPPNA